jgi:hypothetical protein
MLRLALNAFLLRAGLPSSKEPHAGRSYERHQAEQERDYKRTDHLVSKALDIQGSIKKTMMLVSAHARRMRAQLSCGNRVL